MQMVLSRLYYLLGYFNMFTDTLAQNVYWFSDFYPRSIGTKLACKITLRSG